MQVNSRRHLPAEAITSRPSRVPPPSVPLDTTQAWNRGVGRNSRKFSRSSTGHRQTRYNEQLPGGKTFCHEDLGVAGASPASVGETSHPLGAVESSVRPEPMKSRCAMPEPGYNDGDSPPFWIWVVGFALLIILIALFQSCT